MFISKNFPNTPIEIIYNCTGDLFPVIMTLGQAILPFYIINFIKNKVLKDRREELAQENLLRVK